MFALLTLGKTKRFGLMLLLSFYKVVFIYFLQREFQPHNVQAGYSLKVEEKASLPTRKASSMEVPESLN